MLYTDLLATSTVCPFCKPSASRIVEKIDKNDLAFLTYALAPYHQHHLMVVPFRHVEDFKELNEKESEAIEKLLRRAVAILERLGYKDYTILLRNGEKTGKSITHLHYHIIPSVIIGDLDHKGENREVLTPEEIGQLLQELKKAEADLE